MATAVLNTGYGRAIITYCDNLHRFRLEDGTCVFMEWHEYLGPTFFADRACRRCMDDWYLNPLIGAALEWFLSRGKRS